MFLEFFGRYCGQKNESFKTQWDITKRVQGQDRCTDLPAEGNKL